MKQITVNELLKMCQQEVANGNGDRAIVIGDDNEGNGYHGMFFGFTKIEEEDKKYYLISDSQEYDINKILILG